MLRLVSYYTPTHYEMCHRFVMSRAYGFDERRFNKYEQTCETGNFKSDGWNACMLDKLNTLLGLPTDNMPTLYVDADVCLMPSLVEWCRWYVEHLETDEVAFSDDIIQWCAGIMLFRSSKRVHQFWQTIADLSNAWNLPDQDAIHQLRLQADQQSGRFPITPRVLPKDVFCNWATVNADSAIPALWAGQAFEPPKTCLAWHANWTVGVASKTQMLERVAMNTTSQLEPVTS